MPDTSTSGLRPASEAEGDMTVFDRSMSYAAAYRSRSPMYYQSKPNDSGPNYISWLPTDLYQLVTIRLLFIIWVRVGTHINPYIITASQSL